MKEREGEGGPGVLDWDYNFQRGVFFWSITPLFSSSPDKVKKFFLNQSVLNVCLRLHLSYLKSFRYFVLTYMK